MAFRGLENAQFGVTMFPTDTAIGPVEIARAVEERGLDSLFFPEHTHIPASRATPFPGGGELPEMYWRAHDPFVALGAAAAATERIRLGTGICLVIERDPITLAKEIASLDTISEGRAIIGIGAGWNREEMENHGADYKNRWAVVREKVLAMREIWNNAEAEFHGKYVDFDPIWSYPKPVQDNGPPIWIGANSKWVFDRIADYGDGWMPIGGLGSGNMERLKGALEARGRDLESVDLALFGAPPDPGEVRGRIAQGFDHVIFVVPPAGEDVVLPLLDRYSSVVADLKAG
ncbi:MAG: LLM class F420-dependent oxidoreductase [Pseudomonadales bacterium]|nr:LLM class F420-dependent oxidoreductase [Pseudomonadales bacterium]